MYQVLGHAHVSRILQGKAKNDQENGKLIPKVCTTQEVGSSPGVLCDSLEAVSRDLSCRTELFLDEDCTKTAP